MTAVMAQEFDTFWKAYPHRVGKIAAMKAYEKARKLATAEQLLEGVAAYRQHKPGWQAYANPATWLNQGRWEDEWDVPPTPVARELPDWYAEVYAQAVEREQARKQPN
jgi:hypothetical protein